MKMLICFCFLIIPETRKIWGHECPVALLPRGCSDFSHLANYQRGKNAYTTFAEKTVHYFSLKIQPFINPLRFHIIVAIWSGRKLKWK